MRAWIRRPSTSNRRLVSGEPPGVCSSPAAARREEADDRAIVTEDQQAPAAASSQTDDAGSGVRALSIPFVRTFPVLADEIRPLGLLADRPRRSVRGKRPMFTDDLADSAIHVAVAVHSQDLLLDPLAQPPRPHFDARVVLRPLPEGCLSSRLPSLCSCHYLCRRFQIRSKLERAQPCAHTMAKRNPPFPEGFSVERTGIEPVTSGLQSRRSPKLS
jgi:hypothetical protein